MLQSTMISFYLTGGRGGGHVRQNTVGEEVPLPRGSQEVKETDRKRVRSQYPFHDSRAELPSTRFHLLKVQTISNVVIGWGPSLPHTGF